MENNKWAAGSIITIELNQHWKSTGAEEHMLAPQHFSHVKKAATDNRRRMWYIERQLRNT